MRNRLRQSRWHRRYRAAHPELAKFHGHGGKLRLVLGTGRSGTSWVSIALSHTSTPIRYFHEPLYRIRPELELSTNSDHTAIGYCQRLPESHPLTMVYTSLAAPQYDWSRLGLDTVVRRDDRDWQFCLIKEVHSLLATEALLRTLDCPTTIVVRDPVYVLDSLFDRDGLGSPYLLNESKMIAKPAFLRRFAPDRAKSILEALRRVNSMDTGREQVILERMMAVAIIRLMLCVLSSEFPCTRLIEYETLCLDPQSVLASAAEFMELEWGENQERFLASTTQPATEEYDHHSVFRETAKQVERPLRFLTRSEELSCRSMLSDTGLG